ncbi:Vancomycin B-type resistance protein VanW [Corynebacterium capitovis DSM 44611]|uniref:VanW family protein n=1 Tax=Corynebacterium capitovis TaxID=131081 RepID=UPI0005913803|nr:VanW family protein [Corynebacterium capitovis]WKD58260.1 Vancomycin B-type resistance protein VanW [Corynebacterium capitovis DSM 44611]
MSAGKVVAGAVLGLLAVVLAIYLADVALNRGSVPRGTSVGGVSIGGMVPDEAVSTLERELGSTASSPVTVTAGTKTATVVPAQAGLGIDWRATVDKAGEESLNPFTRLAGLLRSHEVDIVSTVDETALSPQLERLQAELFSSPIDGSVTIANGSPQVTDPVLGQQVSVASLKDELTAGWLNPSGVKVEPEDVEPAINKDAMDAALSGPVKAALSGPLTLRGRGAEAVIAKEQIGDVVQFPNVDGHITPRVDHARAQELFAEQLSGTETQMQNARVLSGGGVQPSVDGSVVDWDKALADLDARVLGTAERAWDAEYKAVPAAYTTEQARSATFNDVVGTFTTGGFSSASGTNIRLVANTVNGAIVNPGETFSLNGYTGPRGTAQGYIESGIILDGHSDTAVGGGISQFATTLYNASYFAGMIDVAHTAHSYYISRYPAGREATVYEGAIDLQFRNDSPYPVRIVASADSSQVTVNLMGVKTYSVESINGGRWAQTEPRSQTLSGSTCSPSGGAPGFTTSDTRVISDLAGNVISRETQTTVYDPQPIIRCS